MYNFCFKRIGFAFIAKKKAKLSKVTSGSMTNGVNRVSVWQITDGCVAGSNNVRSLNFGNKEQQLAKRIFITGFRLLSRHHNGCAPKKILVRKLFHCYGFVFDYQVFLS